MAITLSDGRSTAPTVDTTAAFDSVERPAHYNQGKVEIIDAIEACTIGYHGVAAVCAGNLVKYIARSPHKGAQIEDLKKARWYLDRLIDSLGGD